MKRSVIVAATVMAVFLTACGAESVSVGAGETTTTAAPGGTAPPQPSGAEDSVDDETTTTLPDEREDGVVEDPAKTIETVPPSETVPASGVTGEAPRDLIDAVIADLVGRTGADPADVVVVVDEFVIWNDGSLGCAQPGQAYTQALVEGYRIVLEYAGAQFDYHVSERGYFILCEGVRGSGSVPPPGEPTS